MAHLPLKAVLIRPPDPMGMVDVLSHTLPTNLGYIAAYIMEKGVDCEIWDYELEKFNAVEFLKRVENAAPQIIGFSCMTPTITNGHHMASMIKKHFQDILVVVGGAHSSAIPEQTLREFPNFDLVVNQEGEATFHELCQRLADGSPCKAIAGTTWRDGEEIIKEKGRAFISNLDDIPFPARQLYTNIAKQSGHSSRGFSNNMQSTELFTSRGCPYHCTFCAIVATFERSLRFRSIDNVSEEIKEVQKRYNIDHFVIADDTFGLKSGRLESLCDSFVKNSVKSWNCDTRVDCVDKDSLKMMKDAGCTKVAFGVETGSERVVALNEKKISLERVEQAVQWANEIGIKHVEANFIVGSHPYENWDDLEKTAQLIKRLPLTFISVSIIVPYPGTPNYDIFLDEDMIFTNDWADYVMFGRSPKWRTKHFSPDQLIQNQKRLNRGFYLNPKYMMRMLSKIRSISELMYYSKAGSAFIKWVLGGSVIPEGTDKMDLDDSGFHTCAEHQEKVKAI